MSFVDAFKKPSVLILFCIQKWISTQAEKRLDAELNLNGVDGYLRSSEVEFTDERNALVWFQEKMPNREAEPVLLRLARIIETSNHY